MAQLLLLTGGPDHAHDFAATGAALDHLFTEAGHRTVMVDDPDQAGALLTSGRFDALVVNALRWQMRAEAYDPWREDWAYSTSPGTRQAIASFVHDGGGLLGNHTASICFDDWAQWGDILGGAWEWGASSHPPLGPVQVHVGSDHPVVRGLADGFTLTDEVYGDLDLRPGIEVLATARGSAEDRPHPVVWTHRFGAGKVVYDGFGHDVASLRHPAHTRLLRQAVDWVTTTDTTTDEETP